MNQGIKGMELFLAGWMPALAAYYLGGLDTGLWVPLATTGVEAVGLVLMLAGIRRFDGRHKHNKAARNVAVLGILTCLATGGVQALSIGGIADWMAMAAMILAPAGDLLFVGLTGLVLLDECALLKQGGEEKTAAGLGYLWVLFLSFAILYIVAQTVSVLLVNEGLAALTYGVPASGIPVLAVGAAVVVRLYGIHRGGTPQKTE